MRVTSDKAGLAEVLRPFRETINASRERLARAVALDFATCVVCGVEGVSDESRHCRRCEQQQEHDDQFEADDRDEEYRRSR